jgi:hypothetical protein
LIGAADQVAVGGVSRAIMYKIEDFGHALAIAFGLSAAFYYIELREIAEDRLKGVFAKLVQAHQIADKEYRDAIYAELKAQMSGSNWWTFRKKSQKERDILEAYKHATALEKRRFSLLQFATMAVLFSHEMTGIVTLTSTAVSLGSLIYSGYCPDETFGWKFITFILFLSFLAIIWYICFYVIAIPRLSDAVERFLASAAAVAAPQTSFVPLGQDQPRAAGPGNDDGGAMNWSA